MLVLYATKEGQTEKIAEHVVASLERCGCAARMLNVRTVGGALDLAPYCAAIVAASVHAGGHEREMTEFVKKHRTELEAMPAAFLSVSLSEAGAENPHASPEQRARSQENAQHCIDDFVKQTGWQPSRVQAVAGALPYTRYNPFIRLVMKMIAKSEGGDTDTSRDYEYTDWQRLARFCEQFASELRCRPELSA